MQEMEDALRREGERIRIEGVQEAYDLLANGAYIEVTDEYGNELSTETEGARAVVGTISDAFLAAAELRQHIAHCLGALRLLEGRHR
jgi:hypothetical protein